MTNIDCNFVKMKWFNSFEYVKFVSIIYSSYRLFPHCSKMHIIFPSEKCHLNPVFIFSIGYTIYLLNSWTNQYYRSQYESNNIFICKLSKNTCACIILKWCRSVELVYILKCRPLKLWRFYFDFKYLLSRSILFLLLSNKEKNGILWQNYKLNSNGCASIAVARTAREYCHKEENVQRSRRRAHQMKLRCLWIYYHQKPIQKP